MATSSDGRLRVMLVAYGCKPFAGSESLVGWAWVTALSARPEVEIEVVTTVQNAPAIEAAAPVDVEWTFVDDAPPSWSRWNAPLSARYLIFLRRARAAVRAIQRERPVDIAHHVSWSNVRFVSPIAVAGVPTIFGPVGGGQRFPVSHLRALRPKGAMFELVRNLQVKLSLLSPRLRSFVGKVDLLVATNAETADMGRRLGASWIERLLDSPVVATHERPAPTPRGPADPLRVLWVGRFMPRKGLGLALDALEAADDRRIELTIVGDGEDRGRLDGSAARSQVNHVGWVDYEQLAQFYMSSDIVLMTSLRDSGSPVMSEALQYGVPSLIIDHQGPAAMADGDWCIRVPLGRNPGETARRLGDELRRLADNSDELIELSARARRVAETHTSEARAVLALQWYRSLADRGD